MESGFRPDPAEFEASVQFLCRKIEAYAAKAGLLGESCGDLDHMLAALPPLARERVKLMLDGAEVQSEFNDPTVALAARYLSRLAAEIWHATPYPAPAPQIPKAGLNWSKPR